MLAIVSHDIRNPLSAIVIATDQLSKLLEPTEDVKCWCEILTRGVNRIQHIVGDLLDLSYEREGHGIPIDPRPSDLRSMCRHIIDELKTIARDRKITFDCQADGVGAWDEHRVMQAISNLASNAVQHGTPGRPVRVSLLGDQEQVSIEIENEGTIPGELLPRIFEPFRAGRHYAKRGDGLGLGLFIAKAIARAHGGHLVIDSRAGATKCRLVLPRQPSSMALSS